MASDVYKWKPCDIARIHKQRDGIGRVHQGKLIVHKAKSLPCVRCNRTPSEIYPGLVNPYRGMELAHRDQSRKRFNISAWFMGATHWQTGRSIKPLNRGDPNWNNEWNTVDELKIEVDKCDTMCPNCHRMETLQNRHFAYRPIVTETTVPAHKETTQLSLFL